MICVYCCSNGVEHLILQPKKLLGDSDEEDDDNDEDEDNGVSAEVRKQSYDNTKKIVIEKIVQRRPGNKFNKKPTVYEIDDDGDEVRSMFRTCSVFFSSE